MSKTYQITVREPWFNYILIGKKTVEGRLNRGVFSYLKKGDILELINKENKETIKVKVDDLVNYETFEEMLSKETVGKVLPGIPDIESGVNVYRQFYSEEDEQKFGVLAIRISPVTELGRSVDYFKKYTKYKRKYKSLQELSRQQKKMK